MSAEPADAQRVAPARLREYCAAILEHQGVPGADADTVAGAKGANTAGEVLETARAQGLALGDLIAKQAREAAMATLSGDTAVDVMVFDRGGERVGWSGNDG